MRFPLKFMLLFLLFAFGCKKSAKTKFDLLTNGTWKRYQYQIGNAAPVSLDPCFTDDVWHFYPSKKLEVDLNGTNCGGLGITGPILFADWNFSPSEDTLSWTISTSLETKTFKVNSIDEKEFVLYQRTDSAGRTGTDSSTIDVLNYFSKL